jgi:UDP-N-acetylmuramoyl-L-alanyl-D-glutamate--2,6-diaminopimelate ligase
MTRLIDPLILGDPLVRRIRGSKDLAISGMTGDSREVREGFLFFALRGEQTDGHRYLEDALRRGASAVVSEQEFPESLMGVFPNACFLTVSDTPQFAAAFSARYYDHAYRSMKTIGITGTNGKTTTASLVQQVLAGTGATTVFIGTTGIEVAGHHRHTDYTTPPAWELHRILHDGVRAGAGYAVMEVSSHALKLKRVHGMVFDAAVFTNLTHEHMELHGTMEDYYRTKLELFCQLGPDRPGLINADDAFGRRILSEYKGNGRLFDYGMSASFLKIISIRSDAGPRRQSIQLERGGRPVRVEVPLAGLYNAYNAVAAFEALCRIGLAPDEAAANLGRIQAVEGRLNWFRAGNFDVVIDFAHTPDGLENLLKTVSSVRDSSGRLITVFGCPGSRDASKRPLMGKLACDYSDWVIVTSDDVHYEDPESIVHDILQGSDRSKCTAIVDRREAIRQALREARKGDCVVIAGRGHERYQYVRNEKVPFLDRAVLEEEAADLGYRVAAT